MEDQETVGTTSQDNSSVGFVCHYQFENGTSQIISLDVENEKEAILDPSHSFFIENFVQILASSNGLILLSGFTENQPCYYVLNPRLKESVIIQQPSVEGNIATVGFAYDGSEFEVVLVEVGSSGFKYELEFHIFSGETKNWRKHQPVDLTLPYMPELEFHELGTTPPLYSNGAIHWEIGGHLLVYKVQESHCEVFELPNYSGDWLWQLTTTHRWHLCESGGRIFYCYSDLDGFHIWQLLNENDDHLGLYYASPNSQRFRWKLVQSVMHEIFMSKYQFFCGNFFDWEPIKITPIGYSEPEKIIYLQLPGSVVSYNLDTENLRSICSYTYPGNDFNCCSFLSSNASRTRNSQTENDLNSNGETELILPIPEIEKLAL